MPLIPMFPTCNRNKLRLVSQATLVGLVLGLGACASTQIESVRRAPGFDAMQLHKILIVGAFKKLETRQAFEKECVQQLMGRGVQGMSSLRVFPETTPLSKAGIETFVKANGFDAVLVTRLKNEDHIDPSIAHPPGDADEVTLDQNAALTPDIQMIEASPEYDAHYRAAVLNTKLYNAQTGKILWSATSQTLVTSRLKQAIPSLVTTLMDRLFSQ